MGERVLVVEDDEVIGFGVKRYLEKSGFVVEHTACCRTARERFASFAPQAVVTDFRLPDGDALDLISHFQHVGPKVPVLVLSGFATIELAVRAVKQGAENLLTKPIDMPMLIEELRRALKTRASSSIPDPNPAAPNFGQSGLMRELREKAERLKEVDCSTLVLGETGTGKTMLSRWLHESGRRAAKPFVDMNCAGLTRELVESELFGHERGAFTSAHATKQGMLELADGGTLFLDEIGDIDIAVQPKLLKAIEEKRFRRLGSTRERTVDTRIIAATHRDLRAAAATNAFRADLYYRLSTVTISIPPLRERMTDVPGLARDLLASLAHTLHRAPPELTLDAEASLLAHAWPGNVRELKNVLERALLLGPTDVLRARDLNIDAVEAPAPRTTRTPTGNDTLHDLERAHIENTLRKCGHVGEAAKSLGISRSTMYEKLKGYGVTLSGLQQPKPD